MSTYPFAGEWFAALAQSGQVASYGAQVAQQTPQELAQQLEDAHRYNDALPNGPLRDPYALAPDGSPVPIGAGKDAYESTLNINGSSIMGVLKVPKINVNLPIRHGTGSKSLDAGVGHLYGSALPVGGAGTHAVLTAHSGIVGSRLFTDLDELSKGDTFQVIVAGEVLTYKVDQTLEVLPDELDALRQIAGGDYVTLVTCTPIGVNTHRLLVRGERIPTPDSEANVPFDELDHGVGFPWWILPVPLSALALTWGTRQLVRSKPDGAGGSDVGGHGDGVRVQVSHRPAGSQELAVWSQFRSRVLGDEPPLEGDDESRLHTATDIAAYTRAGHGPGVYTWTLFAGSESIGVSACAYPTEELAWADASRAVTGPVVAGVCSSRRFGAFWILGLGGVPILMALDPLAHAEEAVVAAERASAFLAHASTTDSVVPTTDQNVTPHTPDATGGTST